MPRPRRADARPPKSGRPIKPIDWDVVDELCRWGCNGVEVASYFDMHPDNFYERCQLEKGTGFTGYSTSKKPKGDALLKGKQYTQALKGNTTLLVHLGKTRLGQAEPKDGNVTEDTLKAFVSVCDHFDFLRKQRQTIPDFKACEDSSSQ
jgi:hypothetical protein